MSEETQLLYMSPVLASEDVPRDIKWYKEKLGFTCPFDSSAYQEGKIDYAVVGRQNLFLHLQFQFPEDMISTDIRFEVRNIRPIFEEYIKTGVVKREAMREKTAWGTNEFGFFDPSGNRIHFYEDL